MKNILRFLKGFLEPLVEEFFEEFLLKLDASRWMIKFCFLYFILPILIFFLFFLLLLGECHAQPRIIGAAGLGDGKVTPSAGVIVGWHGWESEERVGVVEKEGFILLKLGREVLGIAVLAEGRIFRSTYLLMLSGKEFRSPNRDGSLFLGGGSLLTSDEWQPVGALALSTSVNQKGWKVGTEIIVTFPVEPHLVVKLAIPLHNKGPS